MHKYLILQSISTKNEIYVFDSIVKKSIKVTYRHHLSDMDTNTCLATFISYLGIGCWRFDEKRKKNCWLPFSKMHFCACFWFTSIYIKVVFVIRKSIAHGRWYLVFFVCFWLNYDPFQGKSTLSISCCWHRYLY